MSDVIIFKDLPATFPEKDKYRKPSVIGSVSHSWTEPGVDRTSAQTASTMSRVWRTRLTPPVRVSM